MILEVDNIHFHYPSGGRVLKGVSFKISRGECVALLGVNGAGKSTLLKCINAILSPSKGTVLIRGEDVRWWNRTEIAQKIGYVPQRSYETDLTVFEMIALGRRPYLNWSLSDKDHRIIDEVIISLGLQDLTMKRVSELSGGELQKVMIGRALAQTPEIFLMDEPTSHLDIRNQLEVMKIIRRITKNRKPPAATIVCLHDVNLALRFADRLIFLKDGVIWAITTPKDLDPDVVREVYGVRVQKIYAGNHALVVPVDEEEYDEKISYSAPDVAYSSYRMAEHRS